MGSSLDRLFEPRGIDMVGIQGESAVNEVARQIEVTTDMAGLSVCEHRFDALFEIFLGVADVLDTVLRFLVVWINEKDPRPFFDGGGIVIGGRRRPAPGEEISNHGMGVVWVDLCQILSIGHSRWTGIE